ncbi:hypothetical protein Peur_049571 [Populus x canadensis]
MLSLTCPPMYLSSSFPPERAAGFWVYCNDGFQRGVKRKPMTSIKKLRKAVRRGSCSYEHKRERESQLNYGAQSVNMKIPQVILLVFLLHEEFGRATGMVC